MSTARIRPTEAELFATADEELLRRMAAAKRDGDLDLARTAMHILLYRHEKRMRRRIAMRIDDRFAHHEDTVAAWVLERVMRSALKLALEGESVGEWVTWYGVAIDRQVNSFYRTPQWKALKGEVSSEPAEEDGPAPEVAADYDPDEPAGRLCNAGVVQAVLDRMDNPMHVAVLRAAFFDDLPSAAVATAHGITAANVDQIKSRFRKDLRAECERQGVTGP